MHTRRINLAVLCRCAYIVHSKLHCKWILAANVTRHDEWKIALHKPLVRQSECAMATNREWIVLTHTHSESETKAQGGTSDLKRIMEMKWLQASLCYQWNYINVIVWHFAALTPFFSRCARYLPLLHPYICSHSFRVVACKWYHCDFFPFFTSCLFSLRFSIHSVRVFDIIHLDLAHSRIKSIQFGMSVWALVISLNCALPST